MLKGRYALILLLVVTFIFWGLKSISPKAGTKDTVVVMAASSLTDSLQQLAEQFEASHTDINIRLNFAGTQIMRTQIEQGAKADVFAAANYHHIEELKEQGLVQKPQVFARNKLVLIVPKDNPGEIHSITDLVKPNSLVLAADNVPVGGYSRQVLKKIEADLGQNFSSRVLNNLVSEETNVKSVMAKVALGEADAGIVYISDLKGVTTKTVTAVDIPAKYNLEAEYYISRITESNSEAAQQFIEFIISSEGKKVLEQFGFY